MSGHRGEFLLSVRVGGTLYTWEAVARYALKPLVQRITVIKIQIRENAGKIK